MLHTSRLVPRPERDLLEENVVDIVVVIGGVMSPLLPYFLKRPRALVLAFDNQRDIAKLRRMYPHHPIQMFALGRGMTTHALQRDAAADVSSATDQTANTSVYSGFNGIPAHAKRAAELLVASQDFQVFAASLPELAIIQTNGAPEAGRILFVGGMSGATNTGARLVILQALVKALLPLGVGIHASLDSLGATTFAGRAVHGRLNAAENLLSDLKFVTERFGDSDLVTKSLMIHEAPPYLDDTNARTRYVLAGATAFNCAQMCQHLDLIDGNHQAQQFLGAVKSRELDLMSGLDREEEIASLVAANLRAEVREQLMEVPTDPLLIDEVQWRDDSVEKRRSDLESILERSDAMDADGLVDAVTAVASFPRFRLSFRTAFGGDFEAEGLSDAFSLTPDSLDQFRERLVLIETFQARLTHEFNWVEAKLQNLQTKQRGLEADVRRLHAMTLRKRLLSRRKTEARLFKAATELRACTDELRLRQAESGALERALSSVLHERDHHRSVVQKIDQMLDSFVPRGSMRQVPNFVSTAQLQTVFKNLMGVLVRPRWEQLDELCSAAGTVRKEGLAKIVRCSSDRIDDLAEAIVYGKYDIIGPPLGANRTQRQGEVIYVIPPMDPKFEDELDKAIRERHPQAKVMFSDTLTFGASVMRIRLHRYTEVAQLFEGMTAYDAKEAMEGELAPLLSVDQHAGFAHFNGRIEGDRVVFPNRQSVTH